jgi:hypothetical protein
MKHEDGQSLVQKKWWRYVSIQRAYQRWQQKPQPKSAVIIVIVVGFKKVYN